MLANLHLDRPPEVAHELPVAKGVHLPVDLVDDCVWRSGYHQARLNQAIEVLTPVAAGVLRQPIFVNAFILTR